MCVNVSVCVCVCVRRYNRSREYIGCVLEACRAESSYHFTKVKVVRAVQLSAAGKYGVHY